MDSVAILREGNGIRVVPPIHLLRTRGDAGASGRNQAGDQRNRAAVLSNRNRWPAGEPRSRLRRQRKTGARLNEKRESKDLSCIRYLCRSDTAVLSR